MDDRLRHGRRFGVELREMRGGFLLALLFLAGFLFTTSVAPAGATEVGVRYGWANIEGDLFDGADALGDTNIFGLQVLFPLVSRFDLEIAGEGSTQNLEFEVEDGQDLVQGEVEWSNIAIYGSGKVRLIPLWLFGTYAGAGLGVHFTETKSKGLGDIADEVYDKLKDQLDGEGTDFEWNVLVGADFSIPALPLKLIGEGRYRDIRGDFDRSGWAVYGGLNLVL